MVQVSAGAFFISQTTMLPNLPTRPPFISPVSDTSAQTVSVSPISPQLESARQTVFELTTWENKAGISREFRDGLPERLRHDPRHQHCMPTGSGTVEVQIRERNAADIADQDLSKIFATVNLTRDDAVDLRSSQVRLMTTESIDALVKFIKDCKVQTTLYLPALPEDKDSCKKLAEAMKAQARHIYLTVRFAKGMADEEFVLAKYSHKDLLAWANHPA